MFEESKNLHLITLTAYTYTFVHNENRIVKSYNNNDITLVQVVDNGSCFS